jgi:hypothetical protein
MQLESSLAHAPVSSYLSAPPVLRSARALPGAQKPSVEQCRGWLNELAAFGFVEQRASDIYRRKTTPQQRQGDL